MANNVNNETEKRLSTVERGIAQHQQLLDSGKIGAPVTPLAPAYAPIPGLNGPAPARGPVRGSYPANTISDVDFAATHATNIPLRSASFPPQPAVTPNNLATKQTVSFSHSAGANAIPGQAVNLTSTPVTIPSQNPTQPTPIGTTPRLRPVPIQRLPQTNTENPTGGPTGPLPVSPRIVIPVKGAVSSPAPIQNSPLPVSPRIPLTGNTTLDQVSDGRFRTAILSSRTAANVSFTFQGVWSQYVSYLQGDEVLSGTTIWLCLTPNTDSEPGTGNANWQSQGSYNAFQGAWSSATAYVIGDEVSYQGNFWYAVAANTNSAPSTSNANWQIVGPESLDDIADGVDFVRSAAMVTPETISNYNFDIGSGSNVPGWTTSFGLGTIAIDSTTTPTTGNSLKLTTSAQFQGFSATTTFSVTPGQQYSLGCYMLSDGTALASMQFQVYNASGTFLANIGFADTTSSSWSFYTANGTVPANATFGRILLTNNNATGAGVSHFKGVSLALVRDLDTQVSDGSTYARVLGSALYQGNLAPLEVLSQTVSLVNANITSLIGVSAHTVSTTGWVLLADVVNVLNLPLGLNTITLAIVSAVTQGGSGTFQIGTGAGEGIGVALYNGATPPSTPQANSNGALGGGSAMTISSPGFIGSANIALYAYITSGGAHSNVTASAGIATIVPVSPNSVS